MVTPLAPNLDIMKFIRDIRARPEIWDRNFHVNRPNLTSIWEDLEKRHNHKASVLKAKWKGLRDNFRVEMKRIPRDENGHLVMEPCEYQSKWSFYNDLLFLIDHMRSREPKSDDVEDIAKTFMQYKKHEEPTMFDNSALDLSNSSDENRSPNLTLNGIKYNMGILQPKTETETIECRPLFDITDYSMKRLRVDDGQQNNREYRRSKSSSSSSSTLFYQINEQQQHQEPPEKMTKLFDDYHFLMSLQPYMAKFDPARKIQVQMKILSLICNELYKAEENNS